MSLYILLLFLIIMSAFFSGSETAMMRVNSYKLRTNYNKSFSAKVAYNLLQNPDKLLSIILVGNTFANIEATMIFSTISEEIFGPIWAPAIGSVIFTLVILIFAELIPKTLAAIYPEKFAYKAAVLLHYVQIFIGPIVTLLSSITSRFLLLDDAKRNMHKNVSNEDLKVIVHQDMSSISMYQKSMIISILNLEQLHVNEIMIPKNAIRAIDLSWRWPKILDTIKNSKYSYIPIYRKSLDNIIGVIFVQDVLKNMLDDELTSVLLIQKIIKPYFILEKTKLYNQLNEFRSRIDRIAFVVDEYGNLQGMLTMVDLLEEIVGKYSLEIPDPMKYLQKCSNGMWQIDGLINIKDLNMLLSIQLKSLDANTLSGLIIETLEFIPEPSTCLNLQGYLFEIIEVKDNIVSKVLLYQQY